MTKLAKNVNLLLVLIYIFLGEGLIDAESRFKNIRDPFSFSFHIKKKQEISIKLRGIFCDGDERKALLSCKEEMLVVCKDANFKEFKIMEIGENFVVLAKGKKKKRIDFK